MSLLSRLLITERKLTHSDPNKYENLPGEDGADVERLDPAAAAAILWGQAAMVACRKTEYLHQKLLKYFKKRQ